MLEEYQAQAQQVEDQLQSTIDMLQTLRSTLHENYPEEERTYRMGKAMNEIDAITDLVSQAHSRLSVMEWPTVERPR